MAVRRLGDRRWPRLGVVPYLSFDFSGATGMLDPLTSDADLIASAGIEVGLMRVPRLCLGGKIQVMLAPYSGIAGSFGDLGGELYLGYASAL